MITLLNQFQSFACYNDLEIEIVAVGELIDFRAVSIKFQKLQSLLAVEIFGVLANLLADTAFVNAGKEICLPYFFNHRPVFSEESPK